jgi:hypothetical protein
MHSQLPGTLTVPSIINGPWFHLYVQEIPIYSNHIHLPILSSSEPRPTGREKATAQTCPVPLPIQDAGAIYTLVETKVNTPRSAVISPSCIVRLWVRIRRGS